MKKHDIFGILFWTGIVSVLAYSIGVVQTILLLVILIIAAGLYAGVP